jgi:hypothetical protein
MGNREWAIVNGQSRETSNIIKNKTQNENKHQHLHMEHIYIFVNTIPELVVAI